MFLFIYYQKYQKQPKTASLKSVALCCNQFNQALETMSIAEILDMALYNIQIEMDKR